MNLNPQTGNVYQIRLPYLGFGTVEFSVMDPISGEFVVVHRIRWPNSKTAPSVQNPTFAMSAASPLPNSDCSSGIPGCKP